MKRGWSDIEPKIAFALVSGGAASIVLKLATTYGIEIPLDVQNAIPYVFAILGGYLTPSVGTTITQPSDKVITETHSGPVLTTVTAPTAVQTGMPPSAGKFDHIINQLPSSSPAMAPDDQATQVYPDYNH